MHGIKWFMIRSHVRSASIRPLQTGKIRVDLNAASVWGGFRLKSRISERNPHADNPYSFILRQSVTVLMLSASAAFLRLPSNRSSACSISTCSCA